MTNERSASAGASPKPTRRGDRVGVVMWALSVVTVVGYVVSSETSPYLRSGYVFLDHQLPLTAMLAALPFALGGAALAHRSIVRGVLVSSALVVMATGLLAGDLPGISYFAIVPGALYAFSIVVRPQLAQVLLYSGSALVAFVPLGYELLSIPLGILCTFRATVMAAELARDRSSVAS